MRTFLTSTAYASSVPAWWSGDVLAGHAVELDIYGDRMTGHFRDSDGETLRITVPIADQVPALQMSTCHGSAVISIPGGAATAPVSCWASGDLVRLQVIGPVEFIQRRVHVRRAIRLPVDLGWLRPGARAWDHARSHTVDLSLGGLRIAPATTVWPACGVTVQVMLTLPDGPCQLVAEVVGTTPDYGLRLVFSNLASSTTERLERLIA